MDSIDFILFCKKKHDEEVNQKYDGNIQYSKHLEYVDAQYFRFKHLLKKEWFDYGTYSVYEVARMGCYGHDLIEDARVTYNDIVQMVGRQIADIIYHCTEEKGKNRDERHSEKYYMELAEDKLAIFVKLCDIMANTAYSILTKSDMYQKHKKEHEKTMKYLYREEFKPMYEYLDKLFALWD